MRRCRGSPQGEPGEFRRRCRPPVSPRRPQVRPGIPWSPRPARPLSRGSERKLNPNCASSVNRKFRVEPGGAAGLSGVRRCIDGNTIGLLAGMMILVSISRRSGMFQYMAIWSAKAARAHPAGILFLLQVTTAVLSAFLDNVTTVLLIVPVTLAITKELEVPPYPFLVGEVLASNIGGTATLIGDPPNIMIGSQAGLAFDDFAMHLTPVICVVLIAQTVMTHLLWGREMRATPAAEARVLAMVPEEAITDWLLLKQALAVLAVVLVAFVFARPLRLEPATIAMLGAAVLMLLDNWAHHTEKASHNIHQTFGDVEWITIFFFICLFIIVHGVDVSGLLALLADRLVH